MFLQRMIVRAAWIHVLLIVLCTRISRIAAPILFAPMMTVLISSLGIALCLMFYPDKPRIIRFYLYFSTALYLVSWELPLIYGPDAILWAAVMVAIVLEAHYFLIIVPPDRKNVFEIKNGPLENAYNTILFVGYTFQITYIIKFTINTPWASPVNIVLFSGIGSMLASWTSRRISRSIQIKTRPV